MRWIVALFKWIGSFIALAVVAIVAYVFWLSGSTHEPTGVHQFENYQAVNGPVLVFGGNRGTGLGIVKELRARGESVTVAVRSSSNTTELETLGVETVVADALKADTVESALRTKPFVAVISTLGTSRGEQTQRPDFIGNRHVIDATKSAGIRRILLVTVIGAGDSIQAAPLPSRRFLAEVIELKTRAEDYLRSSKLDYTIIRPGGLTDGAPSGKAFLAEDPATFSFIARADLARLVVDSLGDPATIGKTYSAYDPSRKTMATMFRDR
jgi:uncharacterized protein YbjT (DUF2867 family)